MDQITFRVLLGHNPWLQAPEKWPETIRNSLPQPYVPRALSAALRNEIDKVNLVIGPRQSGKSTIIRNHISAQSTPFLLINCEEASCRSLCRSPSLFLAEMLEIAPSIPGLFFEEIQHLPTDFPDFSLRG